MFSKILFPKILLIGFSLFVSYSANAELTRVGTLIQSNDCGSGGFSNCKISIVDSNGDTQYLANSLIKFNGNFQVSDENTNYDYNNASDDFVKLKMKFKDKTGGGENQDEPDGVDDRNGDGKWEYSPQGVNSYPDILFWAAKASNKYHLFWYVDEANITNASCKKNVKSYNFTFECMSLAEAVTAGSWTTPNNKDLSHITFFGDLCDNDNQGINGTGCGTTTTSVPEPSSIALFALAFLGIAARRKNSTS